MRYITHETDGNLGGGIRQNTGAEKEVVISFYHSHAHHASHVFNALLLPRR